MASSGFQQPAETHLIKYSLSTIYRYFKSGGTKSLYCQPFFFSTAVYNIWLNPNDLVWISLSFYFSFFVLKSFFQSRHYYQNQKQISSQFKSWLCFVGLRIWYWRCTGWGWPSPVRGWRRHGRYATPSRRRGVVPGFAGRFELPPGSPIASWSADLIKIWIKRDTFFKKKGANYLSEDFDELFTVSSFKLKGNVFPLGIEEHLLGKGTLLFSLLANDFTLGLIDGYISSRVQRSIGFLVGKMIKSAVKLRHKWFVSLTATSASRNLAVAGPSFFTA